MFNPMMPVNRIAPKAFAREQRTNLAQPARSFRVHAFALCALTTLTVTNLHAQSSSSTSSSSSSSSSSPGRTTGYDRSMSGYEQRSLSGARPGQPGSPPGTQLPSAQSGAKDGKSASSTVGNKATPGQKTATKGPDGRPISATDGSGPGKDSAITSGNLGCINCATILQVRTVRMKPSPSWMLNSDARAPDSANSHNSDLPTHGQGSSIGTSGNRSLVNPDGLGTQFGKRMYEVTLMMDSGLTRKIHLDMMPGYNLGSKVRVTGNRLLPR